MREPEVRIGTSGWTYDAWADGFYAGVPRAKWLEHYARHFDAVEVNATFYHALKPATFTHWRDVAPAGFRFAIKASRYLTHIRRLAFPRASLAKQRDAAAGLGGKLAAVLWQLPAGLHRDLARLERFLAALKAWPRVRHAVEFRHDSWFDDEVAGLLGAHRVAAVQSDAADWPIWEAVTTDVVYVRLHGHRVTYSSAYSGRELAAWARRIRGWRAERRHVHVYFDNTDAGHAVENAQTLRGLVSRQ
jgi:uncharacterized protein YecE (DUF72 family)